jgi:electron transfer flavoprotein beta subunit
MLIELSRLLEDVEDLDIILCVKHVPETAEVEIKIADDERTIDNVGLVYDINEWDDYALEEAVLIKEGIGGSVTAITVGEDDSDRTLRKCLARGVDKAIRLTDDKFKGSDGFATAKILHSIIKDLPYDLILMGALTSDYGSIMVGPIVAELLGISHTTMVKKIEFKDEIARVNRELEGGLEEIIEVKLPAVITVQTGINEPRYVSIMGIRRAMKKEIQILSLTDTGLNEEEVGEAGSWMKIEKMFTPPVEKRSELIEGNPEIIASRISEILKSRGLT